jgi:hypothetical protein
MDKLAEALVQRVQVARAAMVEAATAHDLHAVSLILDEWEAALLLARRTLTALLAGQQDLLATLREADEKNALAKST